MLPRLLLRLAVPALAAAGAAACAAPAPWTRPAASEEVLALARAAENLLQEERIGEALAASRAAVALGPGTPEALRVLQSARLAAGDDGGVLGEARAAVAADPDDPVALYLLARVEVDGGRSERLLRRALRRAPGFEWARLGLAQVLLARGDRGGAAGELARAASVSPSNPWTSFIGAQVASAASDPDRVLGGLREAVERDPTWSRGHEALARHLLRVPGEEPGARESLERAFDLAPRSRAVAAAWRAALDRGATPEELERAAAAVDRAEGSGPLTPQARRLRGAAALLAGDPERGLEDLRAAVRSGEDRTASLDDLRLALFTLGRFAEALAAEEAATPEGLLRDPRSETDTRRLLLQRAVLEATARPGDPEVLGRLGHLCRRSGWLREAALLAARRFALDPENREAREEAAETARTLRFLEELRRTWKGAYHEYAGGGKGEDLDRALRSMAALSRRILGRDVTEGIAVRSFPLLGEMAETVRATGPCREWFDDHGLALMVGRALGQPVEARLLRVVSIRRDAPFESLGRRFRATLVTGEGLLVPTRREAGGAVLGGATVGDLVFLDLEGVALWSGAAHRSRTDPGVREVLEAVPGVPPGLLGEEHADLRFPGRVGDRVALAVEAWDDPRRALADFLDAAAAHELAHAADAARYLPVTAHPLEGLRLLLRGRLSSEGVASVLEGDAEIAALATSREPRASLATLTSFLPVRDAGAPHGRGYWEALEDLFEVLRDRGLLPREGAAARGLDLLDPEALRSAAIEVCRRRGLLSR